MFVETNYAIAVVTLSDLNHHCSHCRHQIRYDPRSYERKFFTTRYGRLKNSGPQRGLNP